MSSSLHHLPPLPGTGAGLRQAAPGDRGGLGAGRAWGPGGPPPRGKSPGNWRSSSLLNVYPSRLPSSQKGSFTSLRSDGQGPARTGPPPAPAVGKRLRASVSPSCRPRPMLLAYFPKHLHRCPVLVMLTVFAHLRGPPSGHELPAPIPPGCVKHRTGWPEHGLSPARNS